MTISLDEARRRLAQSAQASAQRPRWNLDTGSDSGPAQLHLYGIVGGYWGDIDARDVVPAIRALGDVELAVFINSPGGDVYDGIAIRNALRNHRGRVVVTVDGLAASAASYIALAGDELVMSDGAEFMIHDAWTIALGNADELRDVAGELDRISDNIAGMYAQKAGGTAAEWREIMRAETWYSAVEAVEAGLADRVDTATDDAAGAAAEFDLSMFAHAGRAAAPAPTIPLQLDERSTRPAAAHAVVPAAMATNRKDTTRMDRAQLAAALAAGTITQAQHDAGVELLELAGTDAPAVEARAAQPPIEYRNGPGEAITPAARTEDRPRSFRQVADDAIAAMRAGGVHDFVREINNALTPVVADDDAGGGFTAPDRIGEVWKARPAGRPYIDALGGTKPLTATKIEGWAWVPPTPAPAAYAGELAEVPTGAWETAPVTAEPDRWAFGSKIDRIYTDLGSADLVASLFALLGAGYDVDSDESVGADVVAAATALTGSPTTVLAAIVRAHLQLKKIGAKVSTIRLAEDLFEDFSTLTVADLPAWLANAIGFVKPADGKLELGNVFDADVDFTLADGGFVALDSRAATVYESPQIKLQALDVAHGGVDIGFFAYGGVLVNDARAIVSTTITLT